MKIEDFKPGLLVRAKCDREDCWREGDLFILYQKEGVYFVNCREWREDGLHWLYTQASADGLEPYAGARE